MSDKIAHQNIDNVVVNLRHAIPIVTIAKNRSLKSPIFRDILQATGEEVMIRGITFVGIPVSDQDVALEFYTKSLGFKVTTDRPFTDTQRWIELSISGADTGLALYTPEGHESRIGQFQSIAFWCDDVVATCEILRAKGVSFAQEPKKEPWGTIAILKDPDGNQFALSSKGKQR